MLLDFGQTATPERVDDAIRAKFARKEKIAGFGHRVYHTEDPRATHLRQMSRELGKRAGNTAWYEMSERIEALVKGEKKLNANVGLLLGVHLLHARHPDRSLHADLRRQPHVRLDRAHPRAVRQQPPDPPARRLHRPGVPAALRSARSTLIGPSARKRCGAEQTRPLRGVRHKPLVTVGADLGRPGWWQRLGRPGGDRVSTGNPRRCNSCRSPTAIAAQFSACPFVFDS